MCVCDCIFVFYNHWHVTDAFPFQSHAKGETLHLCIFPLCVYKSGKLATRAFQRRHFQTWPFSQAGRIQGEFAASHSTSWRLRILNSFSVIFRFFLRRSILFVWSSVSMFFQESDVFYIPTSGLSGENLATRSSVSQLTAWFSGPSLLEQIGNVPWLALQLAHWFKLPKAFTAFWHLDTGLSRGKVKNIQAQAAFLPYIHRGSSANTWTLTFLGFYAGW